MLNHRLLPVFCLGVFLSFMSSVSIAAPANFEQAKNMLRQVYADKPYTLYCGCEINWNRRTGTSGTINHASCGFENRTPESPNLTARANRVEVEHIVPISWIGAQFQCGNRSQCRASSPEYNRAEADLHGLAPAIGSVNADRSNYRFGMVQGPRTQYGACDFKVDFQNRVAEPKDAVKGKIARIHFYYADRYNMRMSRQQEQLMMAWDRQFPVSDWERERDRRIAQFQGWNNPFVTGEKVWGQSSAQAPVTVSAQPVVNSVSSEQHAVLNIRGNKNSKVYHIEGRCPSFNQVAEHNRVSFSSEEEAQRAGFRKAGNCR